MMMRKWMAALAALTLCAALLAGCGGDAGSAAPGGDSAASEAAGDTAATAAPSPQAAATAAPDSTVDDAAGDGSGTGADSAAANGAAADADEGMASILDTVDGMSSYSAEGLDAVLDGLVAYGAGAAGSSLQTATAAGALVRFAAVCGTETATLGADTQAWLDGLDDARKERLRGNWSEVCRVAHDIVSDPEEQKGLLADAGVTYDFTALDMSGADAFLNTVDSVLGAY